MKLTLFHRSLVLRRRCVSRFHSAPSALCAARQMRAAAQWAYGPSGHIANGRRRRTRRSRRTEKFHSVFSLLFDRTLPAPQHTHTHTHAHTHTHIHTHTHTCFLSFSLSLFVPLSNTHSLSVGVDTHLTPQANSLPLLFSSPVFSIFCSTPTHPLPPSLPFLSYKSLERGERARAAR